MPSPLGSREPWKVLSPPSTAHHNQLLVRVVFGGALSLWSCSAALEAERGDEDQSSGDEQTEVGSTPSVFEPPNEPTGTGGTNPGAQPASGGSFSGSGGVASEGGTGGLLDPDPHPEPWEPEPLGDGWTEYFPDFDYHLPLTADDYGERYTFAEGEWHLWVLDSDPSSFPGQDSGPRSEVRVRNEYKTGERQFQGDFLIVEGAERVGIWQLFKRPYPWMIRVYDGEYRQFGNGSSFGMVPFGVW